MPKIHHERKFCSLDGTETTAWQCFEPQIKEQ